MLLQNLIQFYLRNFKAKAYLLTKKEGVEKNLFRQFKPQFFFRTSNVTVKFIYHEGLGMP